MQKMVSVLTLLKHHNIPVHLVNGAYSTPLFAPESYKSEFDNALELATSYLAETLEGKDVGLGVIEETDVVKGNAKKGGIDLNSSKIDMFKKSSGEEVKFNMDFAMFQRLQNASGVTPIIVGVYSLDSLQQFLGI